MGLIVDEQVGFRNGFSTVDNVFVIHYLAEKELGRENGTLHAAFIDFEKAFDRLIRVNCGLNNSKWGFQGKC